MRPKAGKAPKPEREVRPKKPRLTFWLYVHLEHRPKLAHKVIDLLGKPYSDEVSPILGQGAVEYRYRTRREWVNDLCLLMAHVRAGAFNGGGLHIEFYEAKR